MDNRLKNFVARLRPSAPSDGQKGRGRSEGGLKLSVIVIVYNMQREAPRTLRSLRSDYQVEMAARDYEVIVVENGSTHPLRKEEVCSLGRNYSYHYLEDAPPSPAYAINFGVGQAKGEILCIMIDGACLLTPGVFRMALKAFSMFANPIVLTRYFFLGPGRQNITIGQGYDKQAEDRLLEKIDWPKDGYRLFEIGVPLPRPNSDVTPAEYRVIWFSRLFESNCIFFKKETFNQFGGCNEKFDLPGGGFLNLDMFREAARLKDA
jgi:glycosyltransferase involved in cell wall biosynthesis